MACKRKADAGEEVEVSVFIVYKTTYDDHRERVADEVTDLRVFQTRGLAKDYLHKLEATEVARVMILDDFDMLETSFPDLYMHDEFRVCYDGEEAGPTFDAFVDYIGDHWDMQHEELLEHAMLGAAEYVDALFEFTLTSVPFVRAPPVVCELR